VGSRLYDSRPISTEIAANLVFGLQQKYVIGQVLVITFGFMT
jgi:hypothetical protein